MRVVRVLLLTLKKKRKKEERKFPSYHSYYN